MISAFYNGVNGIKTQNFGIDISANNIANVSTPGFKYSQAEFSDIFNRFVTHQSSNISQAGHGSQTSASKIVFSQGSFADSESEFSVALNGKGFFGVLGGNGTTFYTRSGDFTRDGNGNLVDTAGNFVLGTINPNFSPMTYSDRVANLMGSNLNTVPISSGWTVNNPNEDFDVGAVNTQSPLQVPVNLYLSPEVTTEVSWKGSLNAEVRTENKKIEFDATSVTMTKNADGTYTFSGQVGQDKIFSAKEGDIVILNLVDGNGIKKSIDAKLDKDLNFSIANLNIQGLDENTLKIDTAMLSTQQPSADNKILEAALYNKDGSINTLRYTLERVLPQLGAIAEYKITAQVYDSQKNPIGAASTGTMTFNENGALLSNTLTSVPNPNGGNISVNLGTPLNPNVVGSGYDGIYINKKDNGDDSITTKSDGFAEGFFSRYGIRQDGALVAEFSNGRTAIVGKLALYNFINEEGLHAVGGNNFMATGNSGPASFYYKDGTLTHTASFVGKKLEQSNADLGEELTQLIVMQKAFDASSKSITTSDSMIQRAIEMKK